MKNPKNDHDKLPGLRRPLGYWFNLARFALLTILLMFELVLPLVMAWQQTRPLAHVVEMAEQTKQALGMEDIAIETKDGLTLRGWYIPPHNGAVILLFPGYGGDRRSVLHYADFLSKAGFGVLMMDPRATGESGGAVRAYGWTDWEDGAVLVDRLLQDPTVEPDKLGTFGCSTGAEIALGMAALEPRISAVVADAPYYAGYADISTPVNIQDWLSISLYPAFVGGLKLFSGDSPPMSLLDAVGRVEPRPLLIIAGGQSDDGFEVRQAAHFYARAGQHAEQWVIPTAGHCGGLAVEPIEYPRRIVAFFKDAFQLP